MNQIKRLQLALKNRGATYVFKRIFKVDGAYLENYALLKQSLKGKSGIEIGGPSTIFSKNDLIPIYPIIKSLDGCNFSTNTIWEGNINSGKAYNYYKDKKGIQYIGEASDLSIIPDGTYDFTISSNCLEHIANPLKAVKEWLRVLNPNGIIVLVLPNKDFFFDHNRPITSFSHLLDDLKNDTKEDDMTHLEEILKLHDITMDISAGKPEQFKARCLKNFENRALHQHVFDISLLKQIFAYFRLNIILCHEGPFNIIAGSKS